MDEHGLSKSCASGVDLQQLIHQRHICLLQSGDEAVGAFEARGICDASAAHCQAAHAASVGRLDARHGVFDHQAMRGSDANAGGGGQKNIGRGLAMSHALAGDRAFQVAPNV